MLGDECRGDPRRVAALVPLYEARVWAALEADHRLRVEPRSVEGEQHECIVLLGPRALHASFSGGGPRSPATSPAGGGGGGGFTFGGGGGGGGSGGLFSFGGGGNDTAPQFR